MTLPTIARKAALVSETAGWMADMIASLPRSLCLAENLATADLILIDGAGNWPERFADALYQGARNLVLVDPGVTNTAAIGAVIDTVDKAASNVAIIEALAGNPALDALRGLLSAGFDELVVSSSGPTGPEAMALAQVRLLRALQIEDLSIEQPIVCTRAYIADATGRSGDFPIRLKMSGSIAPAPARLCATSHATSATVRLEWTGEAEARPIEVSRTDIEGLLIMPAMHEGGHRHGLRKLLDAGDCRTGSACLHHLAADLALANAMTNAP